MLKTIEEKKKKKKGYLEKQEKARRKNELIAAVGVNCQIKLSDFSSCCKISSLRKINKSKVNLVSAELVTF